MRCVANKKFAALLLGLLIVFPSQSFAQKGETLVPLGQSIGVQLKLEKPTFVHDVLIDEKWWFKNGDQIVAIDNKPIRSVDDWKKTSQETQVDKVSVEFLRKNKSQAVSVSAKQLESMLPFIRDHTEGIGTITYVDPDTKEYGALGHQIIDQQIAQAPPFLGGNIFLSEIARIHKSTPGNPGYKIAKQAAINVGEAGTVKANTVYGVFGKLAEPTLLEEQPIPTLKSHEIKKGKAELYTAIKGNDVQAYDIDIIKVEETTFQFIVTDQELIDQTGGILQGMSGSPIIQDGKFAGAITHMVVDNPVKGAAISIQEMIKQEP